MKTTMYKRMINTLASASFVALAALLLPVHAQAQEGPVFELRTYTATPGNLDKLLTRFRDHTMALFEKHGMTNIGYWVPTDPEAAENTLIYLLKHDSRDAANASWRAFGSDPAWAVVNDESNRDGAILQGVERKYMTATDFSQMK
ncbi:NIPSNAP family protein [Pseudohongiella sp.]|uniref:NIPSNAP domain-containing protein n=1 Tax=marine sediment metagenome TaxID=412755 RepID=A0A0F9W876_9ZZZZ|nr:NIPSNAP family protein [Pseudohongiella sp.]